MEIGDAVKVHLPGESPWAEVTEIQPNRIKARILNKLFGEYSPAEQREWTGRHFGTATPVQMLHDYKQGDELWFRPCPDTGVWMPDTAH